MLSDLERQRLVERDSPDMPKNVRAANDMRARRKLTAWLKDIEDVVLVFALLPDDQLRKELEDSHVFRFLLLAEGTMACLNFRPISGTPNAPEEWQAIVDEKTADPVSDTDIARSYFLVDHLRTIEGSFGTKNPLRTITLLETLDENPEFRDRISDSERQTIKKVHQAVENYLKGKIIGGKEDQPDGTV
jgi:hypothetical protein